VLLGFSNEGWVVPVAPLVEEMRVYEIFEIPKEKRPRGNMGVGGKMILNWIIKK
jgi:hypothetical protein